MHITKGYKSGFGYCTEADETIETLVKWEGYYSERVSE